MLDLGSCEFISALAAGVKAKLIVQVTSQTSPSTIALAAAARQTEGRLVCILPEPVLDESRQVINNSGLEEQVEFRTEDPSDLLPTYENIDFSFVDCKLEGYAGLLNLLDVNPTRSVVVTNNLVGDRRGFKGCVRGKDGNVAKSLKYRIGKGMEVTMISKKLLSDRKRCAAHRHRCRKRNKSRWVAKIDEESGEEHIFRVPHVDMCWK